MKIQELDVNDNVVSSVSYPSGVDVGEASDGRSDGNDAGDAGNSKKAKSSSWFGSVAGAFGALPGVLSSVASTVYTFSEAAVAGATKVSATVSEFVQDLYSQGTEQGLLSRGGVEDVDDGVTHVDTLKRKTPNSNSKDSEKTKQSHNGANTRERESIKSTLATQPPSDLFVSGYDSSCMKFYDNNIPPSNAIFAAMKPLWKVVIEDAFRHRGFPTPTISDRIYGGLAHRYEWTQRHIRRHSYLDMIACHSQYGNVSSVTMQNDSFVQVTLENRLSNPLIINITSSSMVSLVAFRSTSQTILNFTSQTMLKFPFSLSESIPHVDELKLNAGYIIQGGGLMSELDRFFRLSTPYRDRYGETVYFAIRFASLRDNGQFRAYGSGVVYSSSTMSDRNGNCVDKRADITLSNLEERKEYGSISYTHNFFDSFLCNPRSPLNVTIIDLNPLLVSAVAFYQHGIPPTERAPFYGFDKLFNINFNGSNIARVFNFTKTMVQSSYGSERLADFESYLYLNSSSKAERFRAKIFMFNNTVGNIERGLYTPIVFSYVPIEIPPSARTVEGSFYFSCFTTSGISRESCMEIPLASPTVPPGTTTPASQLSSSSVGQTVSSSAVSVGSSSSAAAGQSSAGQTPPQTLPQTPPPTTARASTPAPTNPPTPSTATTPATTPAPIVVGVLGSGNGVKLDGALYYRSYRNWSSDAVTSYVPFYDLTPAQRQMVQSGTNSLSYPLLISSVASSNNTVPAATAAALKLGLELLLSDLRVGDPNSTKVVELLAATINNATIAQRGVLPEVSSRYFSSNQAVLMDFSIFEQIVAYESSLKQAQSEVLLEAGQSKPGGLKPNAKELREPTLTSASASAAAPSNVDSSLTLEVGDYDIRLHNVGNAVGSVVILRCAEITPNEAIASYGLEKVRRIIVKSSYLAQVLLGYPSVVQVTRFASSAYGGTVSIKPGLESRIITGSCSLAFQPVINAALPISLPTDLSVEINAPASKVVINRGMNRGGQRTSTSITLSNNGLRAESAIFDYSENVHHGLEIAVTNNDWGNIAITRVSGNSSNPLPRNPVFGSGNTTVTCNSSISAPRCFTFYTYLSPLSFVSLPNNLIGLPLEETPRAAVPDTLRQQKDAFKISFLKSTLASSFVSGFLQKLSDIIASNVKDPVAKKVLQEIQQSAIIISLAATIAQAVAMTTSTTYANSVLSIIPLAGSVLSVAANKLLAMSKSFRSLSQEKRNTIHFLVSAALVSAAEGVSTNSILGANFSSETRVVEDGALIGVAIGASFVAKAAGWFTVSGIETVLRRYNIIKSPKVSPRDAGDAEMGEGGGVDKTEGAERVGAGVVMEGAAGSAEAGTEKEKKSVAQELSSSPRYPRSPAFATETGQYDSQSPSIPRSSSYLHSLDQRGVQQASEQNARSQVDQSAANAFGEEGNAVNLGRNGAATDTRGGAEPNTADDANMGRNVARYSSAPAQAAHLTVGIG